ncbi:unnamed protein product [Meloidogyne enterolobii]|uniref:Uncharacterized protein n=1 Tax=Meloidogyne enterolobii TaxID=390850 RepID=A0ACB0ZPX7_MELEN
MLINNVDFYNSQHKFIEMLGLGSMILGTFIGHVLILERILATVFVSKYENNKKPYFSIFCFIIVTFLSFQNAYQQTYGDCILDVTLGTFITFCGTLSLGLIEIALIGYIGYYNNTKYKLRKFLYFKHSLTERYQAKYFLLNLSLI